VLGERRDGVPLGVDVVAGRVHPEVTGLARDDLLHHAPLEEAVVGVEQRAAEHRDLVRAPPGLLLELPDVALGLLGVPVGGEAHGEEGRRQPLQGVVVVPGELDDVLVVLAHVDRRAVCPSLVPYVTSVATMADLPVVARCTARACCRSPDVRRRSGPGVAAEAWVPCSSRGASGVRD
jgi:hypothetical protein